MQQYVIYVHFTNQVIHFHQFDTSRDIAAAFVGAFLAQQALAGVRAVLENDSDGLIRVRVYAAGIPLPPEA